MNRNCHIQCNKITEKEHRKKITKCEELSHIHSMQSFYVKDEHTFSIYLRCCCWCFFFCFFSFTSHTLDAFFCSHLSLQLFFLFLHHDHYLHRSTLHSTNERYILPCHSTPCSVVPRIAHHLILIT